MTTKQKIIIVTGASQGIGAGAPYLFPDRGYNVVGNSRKISRKNELQRSDTLVYGDIGLASTAQMIVDTALKRFASVDALMNNVGTLSAKPFTAHTPEDFRTLLSTHLRRDDHQGDIDAISRSLAIVPNLDQDTFDRLAQDAGQNCPISRVPEAETTLDARLT
jgi:NAD(P)-dependent dehydrogenase (short-subunit alcohol dehydrogenase family)